MSHCHCHSDNHCGCSRSHTSQDAHAHHHEGSSLKSFIWAALSLALLLTGVILKHCHVHFFENTAVQLWWYIAAFLPVGLPVLTEAVEGMIHKDFFNEFTLMGIACIGAFCIGEYPEAVGVMLFYSIGETLQHGAVDRARRNIARLLDMRAEKAVVERGGKVQSVPPQDVSVGETIIVHPGERIPLDGVLENDSADFDTAALTGESLPRTITRGGEVLAGMISQSSAIRIKVTKPYADSALSRILKLVNEATARKAHAELFIRKFARIYTPIVIALAVAIVGIPAIIGALSPSFHYSFSQWLYRGLVFLVISCPCALVVSVPLGYFAGIGAASRMGILFKGGNYLDAILKVNTIAFDKTGTLTTGRFQVSRVVPLKVNEDELIALLCSAEAGSSHPLAKALADYAQQRNIMFKPATSMNEIAGHGTAVTVGGHHIVAGNVRLLKKFAISYPSEIENITETIIACGIDGEYAGYVTFSDTLKPDTARALQELKSLGIPNLLMLSGDRQSIVDTFAARLGISEAHGDLLPQDKATIVKTISEQPDRMVAFVGDGINDAPVIALSNVGIAMGALGSDAAIESADVVLQTDRLSRIATAIRIGRFTHGVVLQNIIGAISIKVLVLVLGAFGIASLWAAVFADVGVALLAVLNSMRILWHRY